MRQLLSGQRRAEYRLTLRPLNGESLMYADRSSATPSAGSGFAVSFVASIGRLLGRGAGHEGEALVVDVDVKEAAGGVRKLYVHTKYGQL